MPLVPVLIWKLRRVHRRIGPRSSLAALLLVGATLVSGFAWSSGGDLVLGGYNLLNWHVVLGALLGLAVLAHAAVRAKPLRARDVRSRRQFLTAAAGGAGAVAAWQGQRALQRALGLHGAGRRVTGAPDARGG